MLRTQVTADGRVPGDDREVRGDAGAGGADGCRINELPLTR